jgi:hypothetical protein
LGLTALNRRAGAISAGIALAERAQRPLASQRSRTDYVTVRGDSGAKRNEMAGLKYNNISGLVETINR